MSHHSVVGSCVMVRCEAHRHQQTRTWNVCVAWTHHVAALVLILFPYRLPVYLFHFHGVGEVEMIPRAEQDATSETYSRWRV